MTIVSWTGILVNVRLAMWVEFSKLNFLHNLEPTQCAYEILSHIPKWTFSPKSPFHVEPIWRRFWNSYIMWNGLSVFFIGQTVQFLKWTFLQNLQQLKCQSLKVYFKTLTFWTCFYLISPSLHGSSIHLLHVHAVEKECFISLVRGKFITCHMSNGHCPYNMLERRPNPTNFPAKLEK